MKHFYNFYLAVVVQPVVKAAGSACINKARYFLTVTLLGVFMLLGEESIGQTGTTFTAKQNGNWSQLATWSMQDPQNANKQVDATRLPSANDNVVILNNNTITLSGTETVNSVNLKFSTGNDKPVLVVDGVLTVGNLTLEVNNNGQGSIASVTVNGSLIINGTGTWATNGKYNFICGTNSTVTYNGTTNIIAPQNYPVNSTTPQPGSYNYLTLSGTGVKTAPANLTINRDLTISSATSSFNAGTFTHNVNGNIINNGSISGGTSTIRLAGSYSGTGTFTKETSTFSYIGNSANQNIAALGYHNLNFEGSGTKIAVGTISVSGSLTHAGGAFLHGGQKLIYNGAVAQNVAGLNYYDLELAGTGVKTASSGLNVNKDLTIKDAAEFTLGNFSHTITGNLDVQSATAKITGNATTTGLNLTVGGDFVNRGAVAFQSRNLTVSKNYINNAGSTFTAGSGTHTVAGNWTNAGTFNAGTGYVVLNGNGATKEITSTGSGAFNNLTIQSGPATLKSNASVAGTLDLNAKMVTNDFILDLGTTGALARAEDNNNYIQGLVKATRDIPAFEAATQPFGNIGLNIGRTSATSVNPITLVVTRSTGKELLADNGNRSAKRYYDIAAASGTTIDKSALQADMDFLVSELNEPAYPQIIYRQTSQIPPYSFQGMITSQIKETGVAVTGLTRTLRVSNFNTLGVYTAGSNVAPLPVELAWFKAERQAQGVNLTWLTASEKDNSGFEVQVSTDGKKFSKIGFVKSAVTTSSVAQRYSFLDKTAAAGTRYYRLAQIDLDGTTTYSYVKAIQVDGVKVATTAYPNPFAGNVAVQLPTGVQREVHVILTNSFGQQLSEQKVVTTEAGQLTVDMSAAKTSGIYNLQVVDNGSKHTFKLMKQ